MFYGDFRTIADTAGFLLVHPLGTLDPTGTTYWNSGWGGTVDDIGFTGALIDSIAEAYSVNLDRVYSTGMSNGGFMSYTLACSLSDRIAAIDAQRHMVDGFYSRQSAVW
jgi:polyhydroxybutyrate depolymerase